MRDFLTKKAGRLAYKNSWRTKLIWLTLVVGLFFVFWFVSGPALPAWAQGAGTGAPGVRGNSPTAGVIADIGSGIANDKGLGGVGVFVAQLMGTIFYYLIILPCSIALDLLLRILFSVAQFNNFIYARAVVIGWVIMRDLVNTAFICALIVVAFGTILQRPWGNYKKMLPEIVFSAIMVNFSRTIAGLLIDLSQVIMMTFIKAMGENIGANVFMAGIGIDKFFNISGSTGIAGNDLYNAASITAGIIVASAAMIALVVTVGLFTMALVMRIVYLWGLVIFAPVPWALRALPQLKAGGLPNWWDEFMKYLVIGPSAAFFLYLAVAIMADGAAFRNDFASLTANTTNGFATQRGPTASPADILSFVVILGILQYGLKQTSSIGSWVGDQAGSWAKKVTSLGYLKGVAKFGLGTSSFAAGAAGQLSSWGGKKLMEKYQFEKDENGKYKDNFNNNIIAPLAGLAGRGLKFGGSVGQVGEKMRDGLSKAKGIYAAAGKIPGMLDERRDDIQKKGNEDFEARFKDGVNVLRGKDRTAVSALADKRYRETLDKTTKATDGGEDVTKLKIEFKELLDPVTGNLKSGKEDDARSIIQLLAKNGKTAELYKDENFKKFFGGTQTQTSAIEGMEKLFKGKSPDDLAKMYDEMARIAVKNGDPLWAGITKTDEKTGKVVFNREKVNEYEYENEYEADNTTIKKDKDGNPVLRKDENGELVIKKDGDNKPIFKKDAKGNIVTREVYKPDADKVYGSLKGKNEKMAAREIKDGHVFDTDHGAKTKKLSASGKGLLKAMALDLSGDKYGETTKEFKETLSGNVHQLISYANDDKSDLSGSERENILALSRKIIKEQLMKSPDKLVQYASRDLVDNPKQDEVLPFIESVIADLETKDKEKLASKFDAAVSHDLDKLENLEEKVGKTDLSDADKKKSREDLKKATGGIYDLENIEKLEAKLKEPNLKDDEKIKTEEALVKAKMGIDGMRNSYAKIVKSLKASISKDQAKASANKPKEIAANAANVAQSAIAKFSVPQVDITDAANQSKADLGADPDAAGINRSQIDPIIERAVSTMSRIITNTAIASGTSSLGASLVEEAMTAAKQSKDSGGSDQAIRSAASLAASSVIDVAKGKAETDMKAAVMKGIKEMVANLTSSLKQASSGIKDDEIEAVKNAVKSNLVAFSQGKVINRLITTQLNRAADSAINQVIAKIDTKDV